MIGYSPTNIWFDLVQFPLVEPIAVESLLFLHDAVLLVWTALADLCGAHYVLLWHKSEPNSHPGVVVAPAELRGEIT